MLPAEEGALWKVICRRYVFQCYCVKPIRIGQDIADTDEPLLKLLVLQDKTISGRHVCGPHTPHQLLLVLNYLFISSMLPAEEGAIRIGQDIADTDEPLLKLLVLQDKALFPVMVAAI
jgi:hypothetical protein